MALVPAFRNCSHLVLALQLSLERRTALLEFLRQLTESAPVVLLAAPERQAEIIHLIAEGDVEFVARVGDFIPLVASLVERRLRWADRSESALGAPWAGMPDDMAEIFPTNSITR